LNNEQENNIGLGDGFFMAAFILGTRHPRVMEWKTKIRIDHADGYTQGARST